MRSFNRNIEDLLEECERNFRFVSGFNRHSKSQSFLKTTNLRDISVNLIFQTNMDEIFDQIQEMNSRIDASWGSEDYSEYAEQETD